MARNYQFDTLILHEDDSLLFINKPSDISSLDERATAAPSILRMAKRYHPDAQLCHRIDKETSGVLLIAKNPEAYREMAMSFEARKVVKTYHAIVEGVLNVKNVTISLPLTITKKGTARVDMKEGKPAETVFDTLKMFRHFSLMSCKPITGRLHQIRIHLASQNFPISADTTYGGHLPMLSHYKRNFRTAKFEDEQPMMKRVALHAHTLAFEFNNNPYSVSAPYPKDFEVFLKLLEKWEG
jgi:23S rRNA pseudouridine955/2504/2580 synthase